MEREKQIAKLVVYCVNAVTISVLIFFSRVISRWSKVPHLHLIGPKAVPRLPVFSFLIVHPQSNHYLHHNFICALLNDLYGIQSRGGCSCAGPYAQVIHGIIVVLFIYKSHGVCVCCVYSQQFVGRS